MSRRVWLIPVQPSLAHLGVTTGVLKKHGVAWSTIRAHRLRAALQQALPGVALVHGGVITPLLMDVHLPGIDGLEAGRRLRRAGTGPVVVLLSTYDEDQLDVTGCGAEAYVPKAAFGPDRLAEIWQRHGKDAVA